MINNIIKKKIIDNTIRVEKWVPYNITGFVFICPHNKYSFMEPCIECSKKKLINKL